MSYIVRRSAGTNFEIGDLGVTILGSSEYDLYTEGGISYETLGRSASIGDLASAFAGGDLELLDGPGGAVVPPSQAASSALQPHASTHAPGSPDELNVTGLSGLLSDPQNPVPHGHVVADVSDFSAGVDSNSSVVANTSHRNTTGNPHSANTDDIPEGSSLYYTEARVSANVDVNSNSLHRASTGNPHSANTDDIPEGTSLYYTEARVNANTNVSANTSHRNTTGNPHNADTDDIPEGSSSLYYTEGRVNANANVAANTSHRNTTGNPHSADTDDIPEGTNLYYTEARVSSNSDVTANTNHRNITSGNPHGVTPAIIGAVPTSEKGSVNGVATLDATGRIPTSQLPTSVQEYKGAWNASTNTPTLASGVGTNGDTYRVSVAGSTNLDGITDWDVGDALIFNGQTGVWEKFDNTSTDGPSTTDDLAEGVTNLYYTEARVSANASVTANTNHRNTTGNPHSASTSDIPEGANLYYTEARVSANSSVSANTNHRNTTGNPHSASTSDIPEGTNLYYTEPRVSANSDVVANTNHRNATGNPHGADTDDIPEGSSNLYFTDARVGAVALQRTASDFATFPQKANLVASDVFLIEDSQDTGNKKRATLDDLINLSANPVEWFSGYDGSGGTTFTTAWTDVPINQETIKDAGFVHTGSNPDVTVLEDFAYLISADVSVDINSGNSRSSGEQRLVRSTDGGASYSEIPGTRRFTYHRQSAQAENSGSRTLAIQLNANDRIKLQVRRLAGGATLRLIANGSSLTIGKLKGVQGPQGPAGAGSTVFVAQNGTPIAGPYSTINLTGDAVQSVVDAGGGQANVAIQTFPSSAPPYVEDEGVSNTTSAAFQQKVRLSETGLVLGTYKLTWYMEIRSTVANNDVSARIQLNDADVYGETQRGDAGLFANDNRWRNFSGFRHVVLSGNVNFDLDFASSGGSSVEARRARIALERIA